MVKWDANRFLGICFRGVGGAILSRWGNESVRDAQPVVTRIRIQESWKINCQGPRTCWNGIVAVPAASLLQAHGSDFFININGRLNCQFYGIKCLELF